MRIAATDDGHIVTRIDDLAECFETIEPKERRITRVRARAIQPCVRDSGIH